MIVATTAWLVEAAVIVATADTRFALDNADFRNQQFLLRRNGPRRGYSLGVQGKTQLIVIATLQLTSEHLIGWFAAQSAGAGDAIHPQRCPTAAGIDNMTEISQQAVRYIDSGGTNVGQRQAEIDPGLRSIQTFE
jgi:hypothetical protein